MIEILVVRDPDYGDDIRIWVDGQLVTWPDPRFCVVEVDAGAGHEYADWQESAKVDFERGTWPKFRTAVFEAYADPPGKQYITGWPEEDE